jgi:trk system potassium uptake protein
VAYIHLVQVMGIEHIVSPRRCAIDSNIPALPRGKVIATVFVEGQEAVFLEAMAQENISLGGTPPKDIKRTRGTLALCDVYRAGPFGASISPKIML